MRRNKSCSDTTQSIISVYGADVRMTKLPKINNNKIKIAIKLSKIESIPRLSNMK